MIHQVKRFFLFLLSFFFFFVSLIDRKSRLVLGLQLRAISKAPTSLTVQVRQLAAEKVIKSPKLIDDWIRSVKELHQAKPPDQVRYARRMPDIESLMQEWPSQIESFLNSVKSLSFYFPVIIKVTKRTCIGDTSFSAIGCLFTRVHSHCLCFT